MKSNDRNVSPHLDFPKVNAKVTPTDFEVDIIKESEEKSKEKLND